MDCDLDILTNISEKEFYKNYVLPQRPVVVQGMLNDEFFLKEFSRDNIISKIGNLTAPLGPIPYIHPYF